MYWHIPAAKIHHLRIRTLNAAGKLQSLNPSGALPQKGVHSSGFYTLGIVILAQSRFELF